jgi:hypothetical protein
MADSQEEAEAMANRDVPAGLQLMEVNEWLDEE